MPDPITTLGVGSVIALASKDILTKLLGPTAEYIGQGSRDLVEKSVKNLDRIFHVAYQKLGQRLETNEQVNVRVFKNVWDEGRFIEDLVSAEYFGGLLASARTEDGHDETALPAVALVKEMSSFQLRLHFIIYSLLANYRFDSELIDRPDFWDGLRLVVAASRSA